MTIGPMIYYSDIEKQVIDIFKWIVFGIVVGFPPLYFIFMYPWVTESLHLFWGTIDSLQIYHLMLYTDTNLLDNMNIILRQCGYANLFIQDFNEKVDVDPTYKEEFNLRQEFYAEGIGSSFLRNAFFPMLLIFGSMIIFTFARFFCMKSKGGLALKLKKKIIFNFPIRIHLFCLTQIFLSCFLQYMNFNEVKNGIFSIFFLLYLFAFLYFCYHALNTQYRIGLDISLFQDEYGTLITGLVTKAIFKRNFHLFYAVRKIILCFLIVFVSNSLLFQLFLIDLTQIIFFTVLTTKFPYKDMINNYIFIISEICYLLFLVFLSCWVIFDYLGEDFITIDTRMGFSWLLLTFLLFNVLIRVFFCFCECYNRRPYNMLNNKQNQKLEDEQHQENIDELIQIELTTIDQLKRQEHENKTIDIDDPDNEKNPNQIDDDDDNDINQFKGYTGFENDTSQAATSKPNF